MAIQFDTLGDAQSAAISASDGAVITTGYWAVGDDGGATYKRVSSEPTHAGKFQSADGAWWELAETAPTIVMFGAVDTMNCDAAILNAVEYLKSQLAVISGINTWTSGVLHFPRGVWRASHSTLDFTGSVGLTLKGQGGRMFNFYKRAPTVLLIDGTGSTAASFGIKLYKNASRGFVIEDLSLEYENNFAGRLILTDAPGLMCNRVSFGSSALSGLRPKTAAACIHAFEGHHYNITACCFSDANFGIYIDSTSGPTTTQWNISGCAFYDFTTAAIQDTGTTSYGISISGCTFDPIQVSALWGLILASPGFDISGNFFGGSSASYAPTNAWIRVDQNGDGSIHGNAFISQKDSSFALRMTGGKVDFTANKVFGTGIIYSSGPQCCLTGRNNYYVHLSESGSTSDIAIRISQTGGFVDIGPDTFGPGFSRSYYVTDNSDLHGRIRYSSKLDSTDDGPFFALVNKGAVRLESEDISEDSSIAPRALTLRDVGRKFRVAGTWTLPPVAGCPSGMRITILKASTSSYIINAPAGATIFDGSGSAKTTIGNSTSQVGAMITFETSNGAEWWVVEKSGTWS